MGASVRPVPPQDLARIQANVAKMRAQNAPEDDVIAYLQHEDSLSSAPSSGNIDPREPRTLQRAPTVQAESTRGLARNRPNATGDLEAASTIPGTINAATTIATLRGLPPIAALQNAARSLARTAASKVPAVTNALGMGTVEPESYDEAKANIDHATDELNPHVKTGLGIAGSLPFMAALPAATITEAMMSGAGLGAIQGTTDDAHASMTDQLTGMGKGAVVGGLVGGGLSVAGQGVNAGRKLARNARRTANAPTLGATSLEKKAEIGRTDARNYPQAEAEAVAAGGTSPQIQSALQDPDIAPYANAIRSSRVFQGADDATVLREAYKLMSERQGALNSRLVASPDFKAGTSLESREIGAAKQDLKTAGSSIMPTFPTAVDEHAIGAQERDAGRMVADASRRLMRGGKNIPANKLDTQSPEAVNAAIRKMTPNEASEALQWLFGRTKEIPKAPTLNPKTGFGIGKAAVQMHRLSPLIDNLDLQAGNVVPKAFDIQTMLRLLGAANAGTQP